MIDVTLGTAGGYCHGLSRRTFVKAGVAGMASVGPATILQARASAVQDGAPRRDTSVILLWLDGGPSHIDLYDLKPDAPAEVRGIWKPIRTNVPGIEISELFPRQARVADLFSLVRSIHHDTSDHFTAAHYMLTGRGGPNGSNTAGRSPSVASIASRVCGPRQPGMPAYVAVPYASSVGLRPGYFAGNYLGVSANPFETDGDPNAATFRVRNLTLPDGVSLGRFDDRNMLRQRIDQLARDLDTSGMMNTMDRFQADACGLVSGGAAREAFDIDREPDTLRDRYGRTTFGQGALLARRLVEAGCTFVTVHSGGWDHHWDLQKGMESRLPEVDAAVASLLEDLRDRGRLETTMVVLCGEFSRTPRMNDGGNGGPPGSKGTPGRDHWGNAVFALVAGGGVRGGQVVGSTDARGERPKDRPLTPFDLHATIYHVLGVDPATQFLNHAGRPVPAIDSGSVISELF